MDFAETWFAPLPRWERIQERVTVASTPSLTLSHQGRENLMAKITTCPLHILL
jgi:hypothetical protein